VEAPCILPPQCPGKFIMAKWDENKFEVSLGRLRSPSGSRRAVGFFEQVSRGARATRRKAAYSKSSGSSVKAMSFHRRVIVKASIKTMAKSGIAAFRKHIDYIQRDGTDEDGKRAQIYGRGVEEPALLDVDQTDLERGESRKEALRAFTDSCKTDRHHFRIIVSPEDGQKLSDLKAYTRDLVSQMENDLGTKLKWVAANHYDTGQPHTHLIIRGVRDNGKDLVIPKKYIAHTLRERAQELVYEELGPVSQMEGRVRMAHSIQAKGATGLDHSLRKRIQDGVIDMRQPAPKGRVWHRQLQVRRLRVLEKMGLAERLGSGRWAVDPSFTNTLRDINERSQMVKAIHRSLEQTGHSVGLVTERNRFDPNGLKAQPITGAVQNFGRPDDTREGGFVVIQSLHGEPIYAKVSENEIFETLKKGQIITFQPHQLGARKIDHSISDFAKSHKGTYSEVRHITEGGKVSPAYAQAHVRRLEALRRKDLVTRHQDGTWHIPTNYLERAANYEADKAVRLPTSIHRQSIQTLLEMQRARGATWLDKRLSEKGISGLGDTPLQNALKKRQSVLVKMGHKFSQEGRLPETVLKDLRQMDLRDAAKGYSESLNKPYAALGESRTVEGIYREAIDRPSGKFAVIERAKDFTLVPCRVDPRLGIPRSAQIICVSW